MAVEVVHAEELELHGALADGAVRLLGAGVQAEQRNEKGGREGRRTGEQMTAVRESHGRKVWAICRAFVTESWPRRERAVKGYVPPMKVIDCDCGRTLQAANDEDLHKEVRAHVDQEHPDMQLSDDQVRELVSAKAYEASDS
jgi:Protein of unknown function (DUF1059)